MVNTLKISRSYLVLGFLTAIDLAACRGVQKGPSDLLDDKEVIVPITDGKIRLQGFIAGGGPSYDQSEAISAAASACSQLRTLVYQAFDQYRVKKSDAMHDGCGQPANEKPFGDSAFLYVYRPEFSYEVDPGDIVVERLGPKIKGEVGPNHSLWSAFDSFNRVCFKEIEALKTQLGVALLAATCGDAEIIKSKIYSPDHHGNVPNFQLKSRIRLFVRKGAQPPAAQTVTLKSSTLVSLPDVAQAISSVGPNSTEVVISTAAGSVTKVDLRSGRKLWEKNLTNLSLTSVRDSTALNALSVSSDGKWIAVGGDYGYLALLNGATGSKIKLLSCHSQMFLPLHFQALAFANDQRSLVTAASLDSFPPPGTTYNKIRFPAEQRLRAVKITNWDTQSYSARWSRELKAGNILQVGFSHSQNFVIIATSNKVILLSATDGTLVREFSLSAYEGNLTGSFISGASFSDDMRLLAISSFSGVTIIDSESSRTVQKLRATLKFELGRPEFISSSNQVRAYDAWGNVFQWDAVSGKLLQVANAPGLTINYNGPASMPILSLSQGKFLVQTQSELLGSAINIPRAQPSASNNTICLAGDAGDLPPLQLRPIAKLVVWSTPN